MIRNRVEDFNALKQSPRVGQDTHFLVSFLLSFMFENYETTTASSNCQDCTNPMGLGLVNFDSSFDFKDLPTLGLNL